MFADRRFIALFAVVFVDLVGFGMVIPLLLLHAQESFGASDLQAPRSPLIVRMRRFLWWRYSHWRHRQ